LPPRPRPAREERPEREVDFQADLFHVFQKVIETRPTFGDIRFKTAKIEYPVQEGRADIAVLTSRDAPFLIVETKRKNGHIQKDIDPWNPKVIRQAFTYAGLSGAPYFATANRGYLAAFKTPEHREPFEIPTHRVFATTIGSLDTKFATSVLEALTRYDSAITPADRQQIATPLDWTFVYRLRSFVDWLDRRAAPEVGRLCTGSPDFARRVEVYERSRGVHIDPRRLAREMVYVLANKLLFYQALRRRYPALEQLDVTRAGDVVGILKRLKLAWARATEVTEDFEAIFSTDLYDEVSFSDRRTDLLDLTEGIQGLIDDLERYHLEDLGADVIGHVYERLIPEDERHALGQFYTPPAIAEFITRWAVRNGSDRVFDPAAGSGTFLVQAYQRLRTLKLEEGRDRTPAELHRELISQLYSNDIDAFAHHLTAMNLAIRDVRNPVTEVNIFDSDFFHILPAYGKIAEVGRGKPLVPIVDAVVGNPPYTRWTEVADSTRTAIDRVLGKELREFDMVARIRAGVETALYQHFVMHGAAFLRDKGRLGMIVSNSWLQTDVGIRFSEYLLDNFEIKAVLDFSSRLFALPLVATTVLLLERNSDVEIREENETVFAQIDDATSVDALLALVEHPGDFAERAIVHVSKQRSLPRGEKWISVLFGFVRLNQRIQSRTVPLSEIFDVTKGTIQYCAEEKRGLGANEFFYLTGEKVKQWGIASFVRPALPSSRYLNHYTFTSKDWEHLNAAGKDTYVFVCNLPKTELPREAREYIRWGESECHNRDGVICARAQACAERSAKKGYVGWYSVGEVLDGPIVSPYYGQYRRRFLSLEMSLALDHDFIVLRPKVKLTATDRKVILAQLNSTLGQIYVDSQGRTTGGGMVSMEAKHAQNLRVVLPSDLTPEIANELVVVFDNLESKTRAAGGASNRHAEQDLALSYETLDRAVAKALRFSSRELLEMQGIWRAMKARRTIRAELPAPELVRGSESERTDMRSPTRSGRAPRSTKPARTLDNYESADPLRTGRNVS
jgi:hypothetical protein